MTEQRPQGGVRVCLHMKQTQSKRHCRIEEAGRDDVTVPLVGVQEIIVALAIEVRIRGRLMLRVCRLDSQLLVVLQGILGVSSVEGSKESKHLDLMRLLRHVRQGPLVPWRTLIRLVLYGGMWKLRLHLLRRLRLLRLRRNPWLFLLLGWCRECLRLAVLAQFADCLAISVGVVRAGVVVTPAPLVVVSAVIVILACVGTVSCAFPRSADVNDGFVLQKVLALWTQGVLIQPRRCHCLNNTGDACLPRRGQG